MSITNNVATPSPEVAYLQKDWELVDALMGGTRAMRDAGTKYLPQRLLEEDADYDSRLILTTLFPAYSETIAAMVGRVFAKPITIDDSVPGWIKDEVLDDIDRQDRNLHVFARDWFKQALNYGVSYALVEAPIASGVTTLADQKKARLRPYCVQISPHQILGWREENGVLKQLRVAFNTTKDDGDFATKTVRQVRVYEPGKVTVYEEGEKDKWVQQESILTGLDRIPLATLYTNRTGFMMASPPLRELAYLNVKHWIMQSGNDNLIDTASVPILSVAGLQEGELIVIGSKSVVRLPPGCTMQYVEHTGAAIGAGRAALDSLKEEMRQAGAKLLAPQSAGAKTATEVQEESAKEHSLLGSMVMNFEDTLAALLDLIAMYRNESSGGMVKAQPNLDADMAPVESMRVVIDMRNDGLLSDQTALMEAQRRGLVSDKITWEDEQVRITEQGAANRAQQQ